MIPFKFQLYIRVSYGYSVVRKYLPGLLENSHVSQTKLWNVFVIFSGWDIQSRWLCPAGVFYEVCYLRRLLLAEEWASGFSHRQLERRGFFLAASKSVFQACVDFASCQRFLGTATFNFYFILFLFFFINLHRLIISIAAKCEWKSSK